jgi:hypothetical protein
MAWRFLLPFLVAGTFTGLLTWATVAITKQTMRRLWAEELRKYGPEIVKAEVAKRELKIAELTKLTTSLSDRKEKAETRLARGLKILEQALDAFRGLL